MLKRLKYSISRACLKVNSRARNCFPDKTEFVDFSSFKPISVSPIYKSGITPYFFIILENKTTILTNLLDKLNAEFGVLPRIGIELEFYIEQNNAEQIPSQEIFRLILEECHKQNIKILDLEEEKGKSQFEIKTYPESNLQKLIEDFENLKKIIKSACKKTKTKVIFDAQPYFHDCGSALQLNLSLNNKNSENIFRRKYENGEFVETEEILNCIGGLCEFIGKYSIFFSQKQEDFARYNTEKNRLLHKKGKFVSPSNVSWGVDNRTTAIRIPSQKFSSVKEYQKADEQRRIENRVPSADCDIALAIIGTLAGVYSGLKNKITPPNRIFENAYDIEHLEKIKYKPICNSELFDVLF
jgi:glutamine synthetase